MSVSDGDARSSAIAALDTRGAIGRNRVDALQRRGLRGEAACRRIVRAAVREALPLRVARVVEERGAARVERAALDGDDERSGAAPDAQTRRGRSGDRVVELRAAVGQPRDQLTLMDAKNDTAVAFTLVAAGDLEDAAKRLDKQLETKVQKLTWVRQEKVDVNGMKGVMLDGDGRLDGKDIDLAVLVVDTPNPDKDLLVLAIAEDAVLAKHKDEIRFVFRGLKPLE